jgi:hypothetical protein
MFDLPITYGEYIRPTLFLDKRLSELSLVHNIVTEEPKFKLILPRGSCAACASGGTRRRCSRKSQGFSSNEKTGCRRAMCGPPVRIACRANGSQYMSGGIPPGGMPGVSFFSGISATHASVVRMRAEMLAAF